MIELGAVAYMAYCQTTDGKSLISGADLPAWENLSEPIREAWRASADAVRMVIELKENT